MMKWVILVVNFFVLSAISIGQVSKKVDKIKDEITLRTPVSEKAQMVKLIQNYVPTYYLRFKTTNPKLVNHITGVFVIFDDGTKRTKGQQLIIAN
jgi:hypothetical protein